MHHEEDVVNGRHVNLALHQWRWQADQLRLEQSVMLIFIP